MSTIITDRRSYEADVMYKGVWDPSPRRVVLPLGTSLNYVERGDNIPGWRQRKAAGLSVTTNLNGVRTSLKKRKPITYHQYGLKSWNWAYAYQSGMHVLPVVPWDENVTTNWPGTARALNDASTQIHRAITRARTVFQGPTFLAELGEVRKMFKKPVAALFGETMGFAKDVKKLKPILDGVRSVTAREVAKRDYAAQLSNLWIAYQFGIEPLANDIASLSAGLDQLANSLGSRTQMRIEGKGEYFEPVAEQVYAIQGATYATQRVFSTRKSEVRLHGVYRPLPNLSAFSYFGFTLPDVVVTAYEMIPWTFLLDYFYNVNEVLRAQTQVSADVAWLEQGTRQTYEVEGAPIRGFVPGADAEVFSVSASGGGYLAQKIGVNRSATTVPRVSFSFQTPPSDEQLLNVGALAVMISEGKPSSLAAQG